MRGRKVIVPLAVFVALAAVVGFFVQGRGTTDVAGGDASSGSGGAIAIGAPSAEDATGGGKDAAIGAIGSIGSTTTPVGPSVIRQADLGVIVERDAFQDAFERATAIAVEAGGFVTSTSVSGTDRRSGFLTMRVPAARFDDVMARLRDLGEVERESSYGEDVSMTLVDLEARLRSWTAQETVLLDLMAQARTVADTLKIQVELQNVQMNIEQIRGQLRWLQDQVDLATITLGIREPGADGYTPDDGPQIGDAWRQAVEAFLAVIVAIIVGAGYLLPITVLGWAALAGYRWFRRRRAGQPTS